MRSSIVCVPCASAAVSEHKAATERLEVKRLEAKRFDVKRRGDEVLNQSTGDPMSPFSPPPQFATRQSEMKFARTHG